MTPAQTPEWITESHRWHAIECNNLAWGLSELSERTPAQDAEMLDAAHAAAFHWSKIGNELNEARAKQLLGHVHAAVGSGALALVFADESYRYLRSQDCPDWELALAHAILAHAASAAGEADLHRENHAKARELGEAIADAADKEIFLATFNTIPAPAGPGG